MSPDRVGENPPADTPSQVEEKLNRVLDAKAAEARAAEIGQSIIEGTPPVEPRGEVPVVPTEMVSEPPVASADADPVPMPTFEPGPTADVAAFSEANGLNDIDQGQLNRYADIIARRTAAQVAGNWKLEAQIREEQKKAYDGLTDAAKKQSDAYVSRRNTSQSSESSAS